MKFAQHLHPNLVTFFQDDAPSRNDVIEALVDLLHKKKKIDDKDFFYQAVIEREEIVTTGIGMGVAIPHAKFSDLHKFFIAIGVLKKGVDWGSLDGTPVRIVFLIGGPDDKQTEYLQILSGITVALKNEERRKAILQAENAQQVIDVFNSA